MIINIPLGRFLFLAFCLTGSFYLSGCSAAYIASKFPEFTSLSDKDRQDWTMLRRVNYASADVLYQGAKSRLNSYQKIELVKLNNLGEPLAAGVPPIVWLVPQQVGNRLAQLGLNVQQPDKAPLYSAGSRSEGTLPLQLVDNGSVKEPGRRKTGYIYLEGDYAYLNDEILVSLRLVDGSTDRILSSNEYTLDVDANMIVLIDPSQPDRMFSTGWMH